MAVPANPCAHAFSPKDLDFLTDLPLDEVFRCYMVVILTSNCVLVRSLLQLGRKHMSGFDSLSTLDTRELPRVGENDWGQTSQWLSEQAQKAKALPDVQEFNNASTNPDLQNRVLPMDTQSSLNFLTSTKFDRPVTSLPFDFKSPDVSQIGNTFLGLPLNFMEMRTSWLQPGLGYLPSLQFKPNAVSYYTADLSRGAQSGLVMRDNTYDRFGCSEKLATMIYTSRFPF